MPPGIGADYPRREGGLDGAAVTGEEMAAHSGYGLVTFAVAGRGERSPRTGATSDPVQHSRWGVNPMWRVSLWILAGWLVAPLAIAQSGRPPLLDLSAEWSSRLPFSNGDAIEAYADARDSVADLQALGWTVRRVSAVSCGNGTEDDFAAIQAAINASSSNTVIYLDDARANPCIYNGTSGLSLFNKSDVLIAGRGTYLTTLSYDGGPGVAVTAGIGGGSSPSGTSLAWTAGFTAGSASITVSDAGGTLAANDRILLSGPDPDGQSLTHTTTVVSVSGSGSRVVALEDPLPVDFTASGANVREYGPKNSSNGWVEDVGLMDMTVDQTRSARVSDTAANDNACVQPGGTVCPWFSVPVVEFHGVRHARLERVRMPHTFSVFVRLQGGPSMGNSDHGIFRGNRFDELYLAFNRANNNSAWSVGSPNSNGHYFVNNVVGTRTGRFVTYEAGGVGGVAAWNYQMTQEGLVGSQGTCDVINGKGGFGRSFFFHGGGGNTSGILLEGNDMHCHIEMEGNASDFGRRITFYRNRLVRPSAMGNQWGGWISTSATDVAVPYLNMLMNRTLGLDSRSGGGAFAAGTGASLKMWYNSASTSCVLGATTAQNGCAGTNANPAAQYIGNDRTLNALAAVQSVTYPASLVLSAAPSWWCQEACAWSDTSYGAGETTGSSMCKLPAQILAERGTCTPLSGGTTPLLAPTLLAP